MWDYTDEVREHYLRPKNVGEIDNPDGFGEVGNVKCGDALRLTFKLGPNEVIEDIKFKTFGCGSAIASSSILTEMCKGKTLDEVKKITNQDIADSLGGLPPEKMHCSVMGEEALEAAILYYQTGGKTKTLPKKEGTVICECFNVTDKEIEEAIQKNNIKTVEDVTNYTKAGGGCGGCIPKIEEILEKTNGNKKEKESVASKMTMLEKIDKIKNVIKTDVRPVLQKDNGDCEFVDIDGDTVIIKFTGSCAGCAFSEMTQFSVVEKMLQKKVLPTIKVKQA